MPPPPSSKAKQELIATIANRIFDDMVSELQFDIVLRARKDADKAKRPCRCCGTYCSLPHTPGASTSAPASASNGSSNKNLTGVTATAGSSGSGTPTKDNTNVYLNCPVCKRPSASNRIAAHLANCMGISTGGRRARNAKAKVDDRSASPYVDLSDEIMVSASQKAKSKKKESNGNGKRPGSPSLLDTPTKKSKKQKVNSMNDSQDGASVASSGLRKSSTASSIIEGVNNANLASPSPSMYSLKSSPTSPMSTDSNGSTMLGHGSQPKASKVKKTQSAATVAAGSASRGPPGSSKGRSIAAARLMVEGEGSDAKR